MSGENGTAAGRAIDAIYVATHKYDMRLTRICVTSIRVWYPDIPIFLIKDTLAGDFSTREIERRFNVGIFKTETTKFGWGFSKLEPIVNGVAQRALIIDSDVAFVGPVLDALEAFDEDIVVPREDQPANPSGRFDELYFRLPALRECDPSFQFPGFSFNTGQLVVETGLLQRSDFDGLIDWGMPRSVVRPDIFNRSEQGILNYVVMKKLAQGAISVAREEFMVWNPEEMKQFEISKIDSDSPYDQLIHWAGLRRPTLREMPRADILEKFETLYYSMIPMGAVRRRMRLCADAIANMANKVRARLGKNYPYLYIT